MDPNLFNFGSFTPNIAPVARFGTATPFIQRQQQIQQQRQQQQSQPVRTTAPQPNNNQPVRTSQPANKQQPQQHQSSWRDIAHNPITNFIGNDIVKPTAKGAAKFVNQGVQEGKQVADTARMEAATATHNPVAFSNANAQSNRDYRGFGNKGGFFNQGTITTQQEARQGTAKGAEKIAGDTALLGSWLIPGGGGVATKGLPLIERMGINALKGAVTGGVYGAGSSMSQGDNLKKVLENTAMNAAAGSTLGGAGTAAAAGARKAVGAVANKFIKTADGKIVPAPRTAPGPGAKGADALNGPRRAPMAGSKGPMSAKQHIVDYFNRKVNAGNYDQARVKAQAAAAQVTPRVTQTMSAINKLSNDEKGRFWDVVEGGNTANESKQMQEAVSRWRDLADHVYAVSQGLGGKTQYTLNYALHKWDLPEEVTGNKSVMKALNDYASQLDLSNPKDVNKLINVVKQRTGTTVNPDAFKGLNNLQRKYATIAEGKAAGLKLKNEGDPNKDIEAFGKASIYALQKQALAKSFKEADSAAVDHKSTFTFGDGTDLKLSKEGKQAIKGFEHPEASANKALQAYRVANRGLKRGLLSISQFHPININLLQAAPTLALTGHPVLAAKAVAGTVGAIGHGTSDRILQKAINDGTFDKAAMIGTPIKYGSDFAAGGKLSVKGASGENMIFERQIPAAHVQLARAAISSLEKRNIPLDSPEAHALGNTVHNIMGFINTEAQNHDQRFLRALSDFALAPQFTASKFAVLGKALNPVNDVKVLAGKSSDNMAGNYARAAIAGKYLAEFGTALGLGTAFGQKQDSASDVAKEVATHPYIPTPFKDQKGNTIKLAIPNNYVSEPANVFTSINRNPQTGHLDVSLSNPKQIGDNLNTYGQGRLAMIPNQALKLKTNTDFGGKPLHQENVPFKTKAEQSAASIISGMLPIGLQGVAQTKAVDSHLPKDMATVLQNSRPGSNPVLKSTLAAFGATPETDTTTGKGLQTKQYFDAVDAAKSGLNANDLAAYNSIHQQTKDPVTGAYVIKPTYFDGPAKALLYEQHPNVLAADNKLNAQLEKNGQKVDPFFKLSPDQQKALLAKEANTTLDASQTTHWLHDNTWYNDYTKAQADYFNSLPKGDPNRPKSPIQYPTVSPSLKAQLDTYNGYAQGSKEASTYLQVHPDVVNYFNDMVAADNAIRVARGYAAYKTAPQAGKPLQDFMTQYQQASKADRASLRNSNPKAYQAMIAFYDNSSLHTIAKDSGVNNLVGEPDTTNSELKAIASVAPDIYKTNTPNPSYSIQPAAWMNPASTAGMTQAVNTGSGGGSSNPGAKTAGGYPVFHAPTTFGREYSKIAGALSKSTHISKPKSVGYEAKAGKPIKPGKVQKVSFGKIPRGERVPGIIRPSRASISQSKKTGQRIRLSV